MKRYRDIAGDGGSNIAGQVHAQQALMRERLGDVRFVVAVVSGKGGVGKSSITANLAAAFALEGWRVGVVDADLNGPTMAKMLGVRGRTLAIGSAGVTPPLSAQGVKVMSMDLLLATDATPLTWDAPTQDEAHTWRATMEANALREFLADTDWGGLDMLLIDLPPGTDRLLTIHGLLPRLSGTIIVTIPSDVSRMVVRRSITVAAQTRVPVLGLVENMAGMFPGAGGEDLAREAQIAFLGRVPFERALAEAADRGEALVAAAPASEAAVALREIAGRVREALERPAR